MLYEEIRLTIMLLWYSDRFEADTCDKFLLAAVIIYIIYARMGSE